MGGKQLGLLDYEHTTAKKQNKMAEVSHKDRMSGALAGSFSSIDPVAISSRDLLTNATGIRKQTPKAISEIPTSALLKSPLLV